MGPRSPAPPDRRESLEGQFLALDLVEAPLDVVGESGDRSLPLRVEASSEPSPKARARLSFSWCHRPSTLIT